MASLPRYYVNGMPQHIIQRGNNRDVVFAVEHDYHFYLECLEEAAKLQINGVKLELICTLFE